MAILSERALQGLRMYKYKAGGYTWMDKAHDPLWNSLVSLLPLWLAPNLITLAGTLAIAGAYLLNVWYNPSFTEEAPQWVYLITAASVVAYVNLDCMDGKQARRTGSSSPLGQLFDHGCDALVLHMLLGNIASSLGVGCGWKMAAGCLGIMVPWLLAQWEEYHTGIMMYGNAFYGVLEANYSICATHLLSATFGLSLWRTELTLPPTLAHNLGTGVMTVADVALVAVATAGILQGANNVVRVFSNRQQLQIKEQGHKQLGRTAALWQLLALLSLSLTAALGVAVASSPNPSATAQPTPQWLHTLGFTTQALTGRMAFSMLGLCYALTATQFIMAHMSKEPWSLSPVALLCPAAWAACQLTPALAAVVGEAGLPWLPAPLPVVVGLWCVAAGVYLRYVVGVVRQVCAYLNIRCLRIAPVKPSASGVADSKRK